MKKILLALSTICLLVGPLQAQQPVFNDAAIAAAKDAAAQASGAGGQARYLVDPQGRTVFGEDGKPVQIRQSSISLQGDLRQFQADTGITGVDPISSPGNAGRTGMANINVTQNFTFNCRAQPGSTHSAASLGFRVDGCEAGGQTIDAARFSICEQSAGAGVCAKPADFNQPVRIPTGRYVAFRGMQLGLGCNSVGSCQVTVTGAYQIGGNDQSMRAQAGSVQSNVREGLLAAVTEGNYAEKMTEIGRPLQDAAGPTSASSTPNGSTVCAATPSCLSEATTVTRYTKSCMRTFPLTERKTNYSYTSTATCQNEQFGAPLAPATVRKADTNSCGPAGAGALGLGAGPVGMTKVGSTERVCVPYPNTLVNPGCASETWTEYWVNMEIHDELGRTESPAEVGGACDTRESSETTMMTCESNNWFGRTSTGTCQLNFSNEGTGGAARGVADLDYRNVAGCGFCLTPTIGNTCYAKPAVDDTAPAYADTSVSCNDTRAMDLSGCSLRAVDNVIPTTAGGLVHTQREVYDCTSTRRICTAWSPGTGSPECLSSDIAMGTDRLPAQQQDSGSLNAALVSAALADSTAQGLEVGSTEIIPKVFGGSPLRCVRPTGGLGTVLQKNCCRIDLERPQRGNILQGGCSLDEAKLAAARRSSYATYLGEYCSRSIRFLGFRKCLEQTQTYCVFPGVLPRLVQEQGRAQLQTMLSASAGAQVAHGSLSFSYYSTSPSGNWAPTVATNGVTVTAYQWPSYCSDPAEAARISMNDPTAKDCSGVVTTWFAACDIPGGCGPLPSEPTEGSMQWRVASADPLQRVSTAVSRYSVATGACSTADNICTYDISAWPLGIGGRAVVSKDLSWTLFSQEATASNGQAPAAYQMNNIGDLMFKGYAVAGQVGQPAPASVPLGFSRDGGQTWTTITLPTNLRSSEMTLPGSEVTITGQCDGTSNLCSFRAVGTVAVTLKPWGSPQSPECSGFTAGQLSALDFGKMDLSEWLATVMERVGGQTPQNLAAQANQQFQAFNSLFQTGQAQAKSPAVNFARAVPAEGFGPFQVKLAVSGVWPEVTGDPARDTDIVRSVIVDWGDCKPPETLTPVPASEGRGYAATHEYLTPDAQSYPCMAGTNANIIHRINLTVNTTNSGVQNKQLSVENAWSRFPGASSHNSNVTTTRAAPTQASQVPSVPRPN